MIRPPEGRCPTTKCSMVILKSTAITGLSLNLGVKVKKVLLVYFERHARRVPLEFPRTLNNSILSTAYKKRARAWPSLTFLFYLFYLKKALRKKGTKVAPPNLNSMTLLCSRLICSVPSLSFHAFPANCHPELSTLIKNSLRWVSLAARKDPSVLHRA